MSISVIVPTKNEASNLPHLLASVPADIQLVVCDASTDGTVSMALALRPDRTLVVEAPEQSPTRANAGRWRCCATCTTLPPQRCPSTATIAELRRRGFQRLKLWARGVDHDQFTPEAHSPAMRARLGGRPDEPLILYIGRLAREKKLDWLAAALRRVSGVRVALVGDGPDRARLEQLFDGLPVTFVGLLHGADLASAYASADVFAFPSDTETFGNVVLEAMACGLPVVATAAGGPVDLIDDEVSGLLFARDDVARFAAHLERYRDDAALRRRHGAAGLQVARDHTWQRQVALLQEHYYAAMGTTVGSVLAAAVA